LEVKSVPLAKDGIAYFPDGYRKKKGDVVSERALKHINELAEIKQTQGIRTFMCYVVQRSDVHSFKIADTDPIYKKAVNEAIQKGVEIVVLQIGWNEHGEGHLITDKLTLID
jgi:DNA-binding sugar fermentation-stimulating protein